MRPLPAKIITLIAPGISAQATAQTAAPNHVSTSGTADTNPCASGGNGWRFACADHVSEGRAGVCTMSLHPIEGMS